MKQIQGEQGSGAEAPFACLLFGPAKAVPLLQDSSRGACFKMEARLIPRGYSVALPR